MEEKLPFPLCKYHRSRCKAQWKKRGLIFTNEEFDTIYNKYILCSNCELCGKKFLKSNDRQMEHNHKTGEFRNIVCNKCNNNKHDIKGYSNTGEKFITKTKRKRMAKGFIYLLQIRRSQKLILHKECKDIEPLIEYRDKFIKENPDYWT